MTAISPRPATAAPPQLIPRTRSAPLATLARRRFQLSARTPRELFVPLLTPILFALVIAPALKQALHTEQRRYEAFVAIGTIGLLIPLNTMFAGLGVIVDRETGAQRELLAAPIPRPLLVLGNLVVALASPPSRSPSLIARRASPRGIHFDATGTGRRLVPRRRGALHRRHVRGGRDRSPAASRARRSTSARVPAIAIVPWFLAGSLFPITALPGFLTWFARSCRSPTRSRSSATGCSTTAPACTTSGACTTPPDGRPQPRRRRRLRRGPDRHRHPRLQPLRSPLKKRRAKERHKTAIRWRGSYPETSLSPYQTKSPRWPYRAPAQWTNGTFAC